MKNYASNIIDKFKAMYLLGIWFFSVFIQDYSDNDIWLFLPWLSLILILIIFSKDIKLNFNKVQKVWCSYLIYLSIITIINRIIKTSAGYSYLRLVLLLIPALVVFIYCNNTYDLKVYFFKYFRTVMVCFALLGLFEYIFKTQPYIWMIHSEDALINFTKYANLFSESYRLTLFFYHPIYLSTYLMIALIILYYFPYKNVVFQVLAYILLITAILLTKTRSIWLILIIGIAFYLIKHHSKIHIRNILLTLFIILLLILSFRYISFLNSIMVSMIDRINILSQSNAEYGARIANLKLPFQIARERSWMFFILGGGMGFGKSYLMLHPTINNWTGAIDNQLLTSFIDTGIVGVIILLIYLINVVINFFKENKKSAELSYLLLISLFFLGFSCDIIAVQSIFYFVIIIVGLSSDTSKLSSAVNNESNLSNLATFSY